MLINESYFVIKTLVIPALFSSGDTEVERINIKCKFLKADGDTVSFPDLGTCMEKICKCR